MIQDVGTLSSETTCDYCSELGETLRCSACKAVHYCSRTCQKNHWKVHKTVCTNVNVNRSSSSSSSNFSRKIVIDRHLKNVPTCENINTNTSESKDEQQEVAAKAALNQLQQMVGQMSLQEMIEQYHRSNDEIERLGKSINAPEPEPEPEPDRQEDRESGYDVSARQRHKRSDTKNQGTRARALNVELNSEDSKDDHSNQGEDADSYAHSNYNNEERERSNPMQTEIQDKTSFSNLLKSSQLLPEAKYPSASPFSIKSKTTDYGDWNYTVEKLIYISSFSICLMPDNTNLKKAESQRQTQTQTLPKIDPSQLRKEDIDVEILNVLDSEGHTSNIGKHRGHQTKGNLRVLHVRATTNTSKAKITLARMTLPRAIFSTKTEIMSSLHFDGNFISLRIQYHDPDKVHMDNIVPEQSTELTPVEALTNMECRSCQQPLLKAPYSYGMGLNENEVTKKKDSIIQNVCHLPSGHWDEISDYLMCYEGQPSIDFSAVSNVPGRGIMFEDEAILIANQHDLHNICVLAIGGYGENDVDDDPSKENDKKETKVDAEYRGSRDWQDAVGGATLTCMLCCSTLGYASLSEPDGCRLLKHKLRAESALGDAHDEVKDYFSHNTCASFMGKELIRYAESQAVFTFAIFGPQRNGHFDSCLLLRVLSWNTSMAIKGANGILEFRRAVKVIYEETDPAIYSSKTFEAGNDADPMKFSWGGVDLCCPPTASTTDGNPDLQMPQEGSMNMTSEASVNFFLSDNEWRELRDSFEDNSKYFSEAISKATVTVKLGATDAGARSSGEDIRMTFVSL